MPKFGAKSLGLLQSAHPDLITLFSAVVEVYDCTILETHRTAARQAELVAADKSQTFNSKHLAYPSLAVDVVPYPVEWPDKLPATASAKEKIQAWGRLYVFAGVVFATAHRLGIKVRWGGAWETGMDPRGNGFQDLAHWELTP